MIDELFIGERGLIAFPSRKPSHKSPTAD